MTAISRALLLPIACLGRWVAAVSLWVARRPRATSADEFAYHRRSMLWAFLVILVFGAPVELLLIELLVPWEWLRWLLLVIAGLASVWVLGVIVSIRVLPHRLETAAARFRYGALAELRVPYRAMASVIAETRRAAGEGLQLDQRRGEAAIPVGGRTDVTITMRVPTQLRTAGRLTPPLRALRVAADDPRGLIERLRARSA